MSSPKKKKGLKIFFEPEMSPNFKIQTRFFLSHCRPSNWLQVREIARPNFSPEPSPDSKKNARPWKKLFSSSSQNCWCFNGMKQSCSRPELPSFRDEMSRYRSEPSDVLMNDWTIAQDIKRSVRPDILMLQTRLSCCFWFIKISLKLYSRPTEA